MRPLRRRLTAALLVTAVLGPIAVVTHSPHRGARLVATGRPQGAAGIGSVADNVTAGAARSTDTLEIPPTSVPAAATTTSLPATTTPVTSPPTGRDAPGPTTVRPTSPTVPTSTKVLATGPPTGRLAVTLAVVRNNGAGVGGGIATMAADGSDRRVLVPGNFAAPQWTPDGRFVVFTSTDSYATWAVAGTGGSITQLAGDVAGPISPDGTRVVHTTGGPGSATPAPLVVQPVAETAAGLVAAGAPSSLGVSGFNPLWSPDGRRVLYATTLGATSDLAVVNADGTNPRDLLVSAPVHALMLSPPGFSAGGSTVSFIGTDNRAYFIGADGSNLRPALPDVVPGISNVSAFSTAWSPDHQRLAVLVNGANSVVAVDTSRRLLASIHLPVQGFPTGLSFDGSGEHIYYLGSPSPPQISNLYSIALDGSRSHQLSVDGSILRAPSVLP